jgi:uncharacterized membrane protein YcaP (DUF421 family)
MELVVRATVMFFFLFGLTRMMGKRELAEMTAFELILLVTIGDLVQQGVTQEDMSLTGAVLAVGTIALWILLFSYLGYRFRPARRILEGTAVVVVRDGQLVDEALALERLNREEVLEAARTHGIRDLDDVTLGILEADGKLSFLTRPGVDTQGGDQEVDKPKA